MGSDDGRAARRRLFLDLTPLRVSPAFRWLWLGVSIGGIGSQMTVVAVGIHVFDLTGSTEAVALVGAIALLPMIVVGLWGGTLADRFDRRLVAVWSSVVSWAATAVLALSGWLEVRDVWVYYALATIITCATTIMSSTRTAMWPALLPAPLLPAASALSGVSFGLMVTVGPMLAGVLIAGFGVQWTYTVDAILFTSEFLGLFVLPQLVPEGVVRQNAWAAVVEGLSFLRRAPNIRMSFLLDILAMTFGQPRVLFPAVGAVLLGGGAVTVGLLTAAGAVGATLASLLSGWLGRVRRHGLAVERAVLGYGGTIVAFGAVLLVDWLCFPAHGADADGNVEANVPMIALAAVALLLSGAADQVSAIFRSTIMQQAVPDAMRGRMQGLFIVVVTGGPRLGDLYIGATVGLLGLWFPPMLGGLVIIAAVAVLVRVGAGRGFRVYDSLNPTA